MSPPHRDYFFCNRIILRFAGLWCPENATPLQKLLYNTYAIITFLFVNVFFTATEFVSLYETRRDLYALIKNINFALTHLMGAVKCCFWFFRHGKLLEIMETLESGDFLYDNVAGKFSQKAIMQRYKFKGVVFTGAFFGLAHLTLTSSYVPPLIATANFNGNGTFEQKLPYFSWMPFDYGTKGRFLLAMGYQAVPMFSYAYSIVGMDTLFMNLMNFIVAHLVVVQGAFKTIRERCAIKVGDGKNLKEIDQMMMEEMKICIRHLQTIFRVRDELESAHKYLTLGQVTATLFILCTCLFLVSTTKNVKQLAAEMIYMVAMCFQLILYCWFGNEVTREANEIPMSLWRTQWISTSLEFRKSMIFTMLRMKRPLVLTAGKFVPLTLTTFVAIIKASYSCFAVLKNTRE